MRSTFVFANSFFSRLKGLFGNAQKEACLILLPCSSIHTYGMKNDINVAFFDKQGNVVFSEERVSPGQIRKCSRAIGVLEKNADCCTSWPKTGERLIMSSGDDCEYK